MPNVGFGGTAISVSYTDNYAYFDGVGLPVGRALANGAGNVCISALYGYIAGRGAARSASMSLGSSGTATFGVGSAGSAVGTGYIGSTLWLVAGGSARFTEGFAGSCYFARTSGGGTSYDGYGDSYGGILGGAYSYIEGASEPQTVALALNGDPTQMVVSWAAPAANGDTGITGYRVEWYYSDAPGTKFTVDVGAVGTTTLTSLSPGKTVVARVAAKNYVSTTSGTVCAYSATKTLALPSGGKVWNGSALVPGNVKVYNASGVLVNASSVKVWNGTTLVSAT